MKQSKVSVFNLKNYLNIRYLSVIERKILKLNASFYFITEKDKQFAFIDNSKFNFLPINSDLFEEKTVTIIDNVVGKAVIWLVQFPA